MFQQELACLTRTFLHGICPLSSNFIYLVKGKNEKSQCTKNLKYFCCTSSSNHFPSNLGACRITLSIVCRPKTEVQSEKTKYRDHTDFFFIKRQSHGADIQLDVCPSLVKRLYKSWAQYPELLEFKMFKNSNPNVFLSASSQFLE